MRPVNELIAWVAAVAKAWYGWVGASATMGIVSFGQGVGWWSNPPKSAYVTLAAVGLATSMFHAWQKEHRQTEALQERTSREITRLTHIPDIRGEILAAFWEPAEDPTQPLVLNGGIFFLKIRLVNYNNVPCTIDRYHVWLDEPKEQGEQHGEGEGTPSNIGRLFHPTSGYSDDRPTEDGGTWTCPMRIQSEWPLERARKKEGWITFSVRDYVPSAVRQAGIGDWLTVAPWQQGIAVTVIDSLGNEHIVKDDFAVVAPTRFTT